MTPTRVFLAAGLVLVFVSHAAARCAPPSEDAEMHPFCCFHQRGGRGEQKACDQMASPKHWCSQSASRCTKNCKGVWYGPADGPEPIAPTEPAPREPMTPPEAPKMPEPRKGQPPQRDTQPPQPDTQKPQPDTQMPQPDTQKPQPDTQKPQPDTQEPQPDTQLPQPEQPTRPEEPRRPTMPAPEQPSRPEEPTRSEEPAPPTMPMPDRPSTPSAGNPFRKHKMFVQPTFTDNCMKSAKTAKGAEKMNLMTMSKTPTAWWIDVRAKAKPGSTSLDSMAGILAKAASDPTPSLVTFIVYNLPNRDCAAEASNGELCCGGKTAKGQCDFLDASSTGNCEAGLKKYREEYIDQIAAVLKQYCGKVPLALVIEPDSLPNFVTNLDNKKCGAKSTQASYRGGIPYASNTLAKACPSATQYLDAAHGGWLGWDDNREGFMTEVKNMGISKNLRGFALNVANYQPVGTMCPEVGHCLDGKNPDHPCCVDPCKLNSQFNPANTEMNYAAALSATMKAGIPGFDPKMIIDTGRNGQSPRTSCSNWCNVRGAGVGLLPTADVPHPEMIDAFLWLKTPGESDGCTKELPEGGMCNRYDLKCGSADSIGSNPGEPLAPGAGGWFDYQVKMLAKNAMMRSD